jgi:hypothetical protein
MHSPTQTRGRLTRAYSGVLGGGGCSEGNAMETFSLGDIIRLELDLRDESGVSTVSAAFYELHGGKGFMMRGESEGRERLPWFSHRRLPTRSRQVSADARA